MARVLLIDDDSGGRQMAAFNLRKAGHEVDEAEDGRAGLAAFRPGVHELVISDVRMPALSGIELTRQIRQRAPDVPVLLVTAYGNVETAVEAMKAGAYDFVLKPFGRDQLLLAVDRALEHRRLADENRRLRHELRGVERPIVHCSRAMAETLALADRAAASDAAVLVLGESGTGKELIARRIHARSRRGEGPFVALNCAALPGELVEAELFGHARGAFTGATQPRTGRFRQASGGTLFLDEVAELPPIAQGKLLRVVQEGVVDVLGSDQPVSVDVRLVASTNKDPQAEVAAGRLREDLYYRLAVVEIRVPSLRSRPEDVAELARHFVARFAEGRELELGEDVLRELGRRRWPGNVRELENACERMVILSPGSRLTCDVLPPEGEPHAEPGAAAPLDAWLQLPPEGLSLIDLEKSVIERALELRSWNVSETARYLRIPRHVLVYRIEKYGIARPANR